MRDVRAMGDDCIINRTPEKQFPGAFPLGLYQAEISRCIPAWPISNRNPLVYSRFGRNLWVYSCLGLKVAVSID